MVSIEQQRRQEEATKERKRWRSGLRRAEEEMACACACVCAAAAAANKRNEILQERGNWRDWR